MMGAMTRLPLRLLLVVTLGLGLAACGGSSSDQSADDLAAMKSSVNSELRVMARALTAAGVEVSQATGRVDDKGMSTRRAQDYLARAVLEGSGDEGDQVAQAAGALEEAGWTRTAAGLDAGEANPWVQLERDDFRTTIGWTKVGTRELALSLDRAGDVEVPDDTPVVERDNSEDIPLD
jgi:ABC-type glycerol-3-phosphate transport system substrate-binding protein